MATEIRNDDFGIFLARELEHILARTFETEYADLKYSKLIPVSTEVGPGAETFTYRIFDKQGQMKIIGDKANDLPRVDVERSEVTHQIRTLGGEFAYTIQEIEAAARVPGMMLEQRRANAVRRAYEQAVQEIAYFGDAASGIKGFFNNDQIDKVVSDHWPGTDADMTADEMIDFLNKGPTEIVNTTNMKEMPNTMLVPYKVYREISTKPRSTTSDTTIMEFFLRTNPMITSIEPVNELEASKGKLTQDRCIIYDRNPDKLQLHIPVQLQFLPPQRKKLEFEVAARARIGGVSVYYPKSVIALENS